MKTIVILKEKEVVYQKVSEQFTIKINKKSDEPDGWKAFSPILTLRFTSDDNGSEPISNVLQQYENDDVIDVKSELGIE